MRQREQNGHVYRAFGAFHVRYWVAYNDLPAVEQEKIRTRLERSNRKREIKGEPVKALPSRVQKSERLCNDTATRKEHNQAFKE